MHYCIHCAQFLFGESEYCMKCNQPTLLFAHIYCDQCAQFVETVEQQCSCCGHEIPC